MFYPRLNESPDRVLKYNPEYGYAKNVARVMEDNSFAFGYDKYGDIHLSDDRETHGDLVNTHNIEDGNPIMARTYLNYAGRIWFNQQLISFWEYPKTNNDMKKIINDLEMMFLEKFDEEVNIWDNFKVEINDREDIKEKDDDGEWSRWREEDVKLIPLKDFKGSKDQSKEDIGKDHVKSPMQKTDKSKAGYLKNRKQKPLAWRQAMYAESVKENLNESPDQIYAVNRVNREEYDGIGYYSHNHLGAFPFGYYGGKMRVGRPYKLVAHDEIKKEYEDLVTKNLERKDYKLGGRAWKDAKIISFWDYPKTSEKFKQVLHDIQTEFNKRFSPDYSIDFSSGWVVEINDEKNWGEEKIIPIEDFVGSNDTSEEEKRKEHEKSPLLKKPNTSKSGYLKNRKQKPLAWRQAMYAESYEENFYPSLNENPNASIDPKIWNKYKDKKSYTPQKIEYNEEGNIPFSYFNGQLVTGTPNQIHMQLMQKAGRLGIIKKPENERTTNSGRIFTNYKFISFWKYPKTHEELIKVIKDLEKETKLKILNDPEWLIEIPAGEFRKAIDDDSASWGSWNPRIGQIEFIPIKDYKGGYTRSEKEMNQKHIDTPMNKRNYTVPKGYGSKADNKPLSWKQAMYSESYYPRLKS